MKPAGKRPREEKSSHASHATVSKSSTAVSVLLAPEDSGPNPHYANAADDGLPAIPYAPSVGVVLLVESSLDPIAALSQVVAAEAVTFSSMYQGRVDMLASQYALARAAETRTVEVGAEVRAQAATAVAREFVESVESGLSASAASARASARLRDWGVPASAVMLTAVRAAIVASRDPGGMVTEEGDECEGLALTHEDGDEGASSRPVAGATSGAGFLRGEWEVAFPPRARGEWRYPSDGGEGGMLDPALRADARMALRRPAFPDRLHPSGGSGGPGGGPTHLRSLALALQWDEAGAVEERLDRLRYEALRGLVQ
jgi:hypothetical protein